jgi:hypothetical protein
MNLAGRNKPAASFWDERRMSMAKGRLVFCGNPNQQHSGAILTHKIKICSV